MRVGKLGTAEIVLPDTIYEVYKLGDANSFSVVTINALNRGIEPCKFDIGIKDSNGDIAWLEYKVEVQPKSVVIRTGVNISSGDIIVARSNKALCNIVITGSQSSNNLSAVAFPELTSVNSVAPAAPLPLTEFGTQIISTGAFDAISIPGSQEVTVNISETNLELLTVASPQPLVDIGFGDAIAITDYYLFVGAPLDSASEVEAGAVYVYETFTGTLASTIRPAVSIVSGNFGASLAVDADNGFLFIGEPGHNNSTGIVYKYDIATFTLSSVGASSLSGVSAGDYFGDKLAINGTMLLARADAGSSPSVSIVDTITMNRSNTLSGGSGYGKSMLVNSSYIVIGNPNQTINGFLNAGEVQVRDRTTQTLIAAIEPRQNELTNNLLFGSSIGITSQLLWIGAPGYNSDTGKVYSYLVGSFEGVADAVNPESQIGSSFGSSIAATDAKTIIAAPQAVVGANNAAGKLYIFREDPTAYQQRSVPVFITTPLTDIEQEATYDIRVEIELPYTDSTGFEIPWNFGGYNQVVDGATSGVGILTQPGVGNPFFVVSFDTKTYDQLDFELLGPQQLTFSVFNETLEFIVTPSAGVLYKFTEATFTSNLASGTAGRRGPTLAEALVALDIATDPGWETNTEFFSVGTVADGVPNTGDGLGMQLWTVPADGTYRIQAWGASSGTTPSYNPGWGAKLQGDIDLLQGDQLSFLVGQKGDQGGHSQNTGQWVAAGGGGTFVVKREATAPVLLLAAGGGGGGAQNSWTNNSGISANASSTTGGSGQGGQAGGANGAAGATSGHGGAGAGYTGGAPIPSGSSSGEQSMSWAYGMKGSENARSWGGPQIYGGFGGGGGGGGLAAGGGGGYSGGGSGSWSSQQSAGGGGSYANTTLMANILRTNGGSVGAQITGNGKVIVTKIA